MSSRMLRLMAAAACAVVAATGVSAGAAGQAAGTAGRFFPDDPISRDDDTAMDATGLKEYELSESYDFLINSFVSPGDREPIRAVNVWVNGSYVQPINGVAAQSKAVIRTDKLYNGLGNTFASRNEEVARVQIETQDGVYNVMGPATE